VGGWFWGDETPPDKKCVYSTGGSEKNGPPAATLLTDWERRIRSHMDKNRAWGATGYDDLMG